ncbi:MAG: MgtC/SapB family protein [Terriglobales bacterium]
MSDLLHIFGLRPGVAAVISHMLLRLVVAAILGGIIGLEREVKQKPAGLRTQMFICFGAAMFTMLSDQLAATWGGDHTRIAAQIIPGIGFIGAGSILHSRGSVTGLTTAATLFVVASIGMAVGGGLFLPAIFATLVLLLALHLLGVLEGRFSLKAVAITYEVVGDETQATMNALNAVLDSEHQSTQSVIFGRIDHAFRVQFTVAASRKEHDALLQQLRKSPEFKRVESLGVAERE